MVKVSIVRPGEGEAIALGPAVQMRILEDGRTTQHRIGMAESTLAPHTAGPPSTATPSTTKGSTSCRERCASPSATRTTTPVPER